ncbi:MAG: hypothetical protein OQJ74_05445, partial [Ignavibacteriaceae bacterium]|nr:hypothetical protein [Ignavibacteriaceae bacterium]
VIPNSIDQSQYSRLKEFKESCRKRGIFESYIDVNDFKTKFYRQLQLRINQDSYFGESDNVFNQELDRSNIPDIPILSREAQILLKEMSTDPHGMVMMLLDSSGFTVQVNSRNLLEDPKSAKHRAIWESAAKELESEELIKPEGYKGEIFILTKKGFDIADLIKL